MATLTVYPAASTAASGGVENEGVNVTWTTIRDATAGVGTTGGADTDITLRVRATATTDRWDRMFRWFMRFDTSALGADVTINSATMGIYGTGIVIDTTGAAEVALVTTSAASDTALVTGDYDQIADVKQATNIAVASWSASAYNVFTLDATGLSNISKTGVTKFGNRMENDRANDSTWSSGRDAVVQGKTANQSGTSNDPYITIDYTAGGGGGAVRDARLLSLLGVA